MYLKCLCLRNCLLYCNMNVVNRISCVCLIIFFLEWIGGVFGHPFHSPTHGMTSVNVDRAENACAALSGVCRQGFSGFYHSMKELHLTHKEATLDQFAAAVNNCTAVLSPVRYCLVSLVHYCLVSPVCYCLVSPAHYCLVSPVCYVSCTCCCKQFLPGHFLLGS